jgi:hypothetical protein
MLAAVRPRQRFRGSFLKQSLHGAPLVAHVGQAQLGSTFPSDDDEIDPVGQEPGPLPEALPAEALDAVAADGRADALGDHEAQAGRTGWGRLRGHEEREMRRSDAAPLALGDDELAVLAQASRAEPRRLGAHVKKAGLPTRPERYFL